MKQKLTAKIGSKEDKFWFEVMTKTKEEIDRLEKMLKFNKAILEMCKTKTKGIKKIKWRLEKMYLKGCQKKWDDFFVLSVIFFTLGNISFFIYPVLNLWLCFFTLGAFCLSIFLIFTKGGINANSS